MRLGRKLKKFDGLRQGLDVVCYYMRTLITTLCFTLFTKTCLCQKIDSSQLFYVDRITVEKPLIIDYDYGSCWISHRFKIIISTTHSPDSFQVTIRKYLPVEYRLYRDNKKKSKAIVQRDIKIDDPFTFKFPVTGPGEYYSVKSEYLMDTAFMVARTTIKNYLSDFEFQADRNKILTDGSGISGLYCNIQLANGNTAKKYWFDGWYQLDDELKRKK